MRSLCPAARTFACLLVCYALVISLLAPLSARRVAAATAAAPPAKATAGRPAASAGQAKSKGPHKARELMVRFKSGTSEAQRQQLLSFKGARRLKKLKGKSRVEKIEAPANADLEALATEFKALPGVELAEPNYIVTKEDTTPDDARFSEQWALQNLGQTGGQAGADINAAPASTST